VEPYWGIRTWFTRVIKKTGLRTGKIAMRNRKIILLAAGLMIVLAFLAFLLIGNPFAPRKMEKLRMGIFPDTICALVYIAQQQDIFKRYGLDLSFQNYQAGAFAVNDLMAGKVDVATAADYVLAVQGFKRGDLRGVSTVSLFQSHEMVGRKDRGIGKPEDLRGKVIGVAKGTATEFFLSTFLSFNNIHSKDVHIMDLKPSDLVTALSEGKIDAAGCFPPFTDMMKGNLAQNVISWPLQGDQDSHFLLITTEQMVKTRPHVITSLLKGVMEAEGFLKKNEQEARSIIERILKLDREVLMSTWSKTRFRVGLDQNLLTLMEDEARWAITNKYVDSTKVPNYLPFLYLDGLMKLKPEAVSVIH
jgi:NitT/TauT family transport system substrate-binding protein